MAVIMPAQKPGKSRQDYETPWEFIHAVETMLSEKFEVDLAATANNTKATRYVGYNSLNQDWDTYQGLLWLNPPFANIEPWAKKCAESVKARICFLVPASIGSNWFTNYVHNKAMVLALSPRISFDGKGPYPKDCILAVYRNLYLSPITGFRLWRWKD
jgi:phage N-6-adenine-methyltransferase